MPDLANRITEAEAHALRLRANGDPIAAQILDESGRFWAPIVYTAATGRAKCRLCGGRCAPEEPTIAFGFGGGGYYTRVVTAFLHVKCPTGGE